MEPLKVAEFVRAAGIPAPDPPLAPLGFSRTSALQEPVLTPASQWLGQPPERLRHAGHEWTSPAPLRAGQTYRLTDWTLTGDRGTRTRSGAAVRFASFSRQVRDRAGELVLLERMTVAVLGSSEGAPEGAPAPAGAGPGAPAGVVAGPFTVTDFVRFAGAVGDFNPIHHDPAAARRAGLPGVIAMGMLPGAILLDLAGRELGIARVQRYGLRFRSPLYAGEELRLRPADGHRRDGVDRVELVGTAPDGRPVLTGYAQVAP